MGESILQKIVSAGYGKIFTIFLISMLPIAELRGGIPVGLLIYKLPLKIVLPVAIIGNLVPVIPLLLFLKKLIDFFSKYKIFRGFIERVIRRAERQSDVVQRYKTLGLAIFVGIPLPVTGAWTGSLVAVLTGLGFKRSIIGIIIGVLIASAIVSTLCLLGKWVATLPSSA